VIAPRVAAILATELDWDETRQTIEVEGYLASARREFSVAPPAAVAPPAVVVRPAAADPLGSGSGSAD
jgi:hypothetical protein